MLAEKAAADRKETRKTGFDKMHERDAGSYPLKDFTGRNVTILWNTRREPEDYEPYIEIPEDKFFLEFKNKHGETERMVFNTDDFRQQLRWA